MPPRGPAPRRSALACGLLLALAAGCRAPHLPPLPRDERVEGPAPVARVRLPDEVAVRLAGLERAEHVRVDGTSLGAVELRRSGDGVAGADGRVLPRAVLEPLPGGDGLSCGGRTYPGRLLVEPHRAGGLHVTALVALEDYVAGVVAAELVLWSALPAELEAQAISARTYVAAALAARGGGVDAFVWDDTRDQAFRGRFLPGASAGGREVARRLERAVAATRGLVLLFDGALLDARFCASCGGRSAALAQVFPQFAGPGAAASPGGVVCPPCERIGAAELAAAEETDGNGEVLWRFTAGERELRALAARLGLGGRVVELRPAELDRDGRWLAVELSGDERRRRVDLVELRRLVGPDRLRSGRVLRTWPRPGEPIVGGLYMEGLGHGHGVGLCQRGAHGLAQDGWSARRILAHYHPGAAVGALDGPLASRP